MIDVLDAMCTSPAKGDSLAEAQEAFTLYAEGLFEPQKRLARPWALPRR